MARGNTETDEEKRERTIRPEADFAPKIRRKRRAKAEIENEKNTSFASDRPTNSKSVRGQDGSPETIAFQEKEAVKVRRGRKPKVQKLSIEEAKSQAESMVQAIEAIATGFVGSEATYKQEERALLLTGATGMFSTVSAENVEKVAALLWPLCFVAGAALYGTRVVGVVAKKQEALKQERMVNTWKPVEDVLEHSQDETSPKTHNPLDIFDHD